MLDRLARRPFANPTTLILAFAVTLMTAVALPVIADDGAAGKSIDKPLPAECALLDDLDKRALMDGLLLKLAIMCDRTEFLGQVLQAPNMEVGGPDTDTDVPVNDPAGDSGSSTTQSETSLAVSGTTGTICSGFNDSYHGVVQGQGYTGFARSTDGGATFTDGLALGSSSYGDPAMVWRKTDGNFYFATLHSSGLGLYKSTDDCQTFQQAAIIHAGGSDDKELMAVDNNPTSPYYGNLYVVWTNFTDGRIWSTTSTNGGTTWGATQGISSSSNVQGAWPAVAPDGTVYASWVEFGSSISIPVSRSTNGGTSWSAVTAPAVNKVQPQDSAATGNCGRAALKGNIRYLPSPQIAVGPDNVVHVIYTYDPDTAGSGDTVSVFYRRSTDQGATWQTEILLNDDGTTRDQFFPTLSVGATNIASAAWYDRRDDPNNTLVDYYQRISYDGGVTWEPSIRVSDVQTPIYIDPNLASCYHGDYDTQVQTETAALIQWSDDRRSYNSHNDPDVYLDTVQVSTDFLLTADPTAVSVCSPNSAVFAINVLQFQGFNESVTLGAAGVPAGATAGFAPNPVTPPGASTLTVSGTGGAAPGTYQINITGTSTPSGIVHDTDVTLHLFNANPGTPDLVAPADGAINQPARPVFSWNPAAQAQTYRLQVATDVGFNSVVLDIVGLTETTATPAVDLESNTPYFWRVQADNTCGTSAWSAPFTFTTIALPGDCGIGTVATSHFSDNFESGAPGWTTGGVGSTWALGSGVSGVPHSGSFVYHANDVSSVSDQWLISPPVVLPSGPGHTTINLQFWNYQEMEPNGTTACFDGGLLEITTDGGANWTQLPNGVMQTDPYDGLVSGSFSNPLAGLDAWCGDPQDWLESVVDLDAYAGETVQFRFRLGTDSSVSRPGWDIDDVKVQSCIPSEPPFFADGFESGDTSGWDQTVP